MSFSASKVGHQNGVAQAVGQVLYEGQIDAEVTGFWTCPADGSITSVCVVAVGAGGRVLISPSAVVRGSPGGGLGWKNNIPVVPGQTYAYQVGKPGSPTFFISTATVAGYSPSQNSSVGGTFVGDGGGNGGASGESRGGGGAGGYAGNGTAGGHYTEEIDMYSSAATGGAASGGADGGFYPWDGEQAWGNPSGSGGGVGLLGQGASGAATTYLGQGGRAGSNGVNAQDAASDTSGPGGKYGGGVGSAPWENYFGEYWHGPAADPGVGGLRIIWGPNRAFPSTNTQDM